MNLPGRPGGNWTWRVKTGDLSPELAARIHENNYLYSRLLGDEVDEAQQAIKITTKATEMQK
jgi:hypothetical protein